MEESLLFAPILIVIHIFGKPTARCIGAAGPALKIKDSINAQKIDFFKNFYSGVYTYARNREEVIQKGKVFKKY
ncbi:hypothetical protein Y032_0005g2697 [Ancylostoma ceylanicum]|uniref:Uncharacterized protein n=1 Tax=Ancylostoma ceylanicum TaxID=53326 RepID=A0A016VT23_9BILA|nr:hypothetical protein Y032_0005g2697 [Ancylostoma ceylanicum]